ncbi:uncharacterized protein [Diadema setosum]|uniref:uncharacterized protein n=1 Tax=Diadema setosum TaxID=31175 RepID=UPI003B3B8274
MDGGAVSESPDASAETVFTYTTVDVLLAINLLLTIASVSYTSAYASYYYGSTGTVPSVERYAAGDTDPPAPVPVTRRRRRRGSATRWSNTSRRNRTNARRSSSTIITAPEPPPATAAEGGGAGDVAAAHSTRWNIFTLLEIARDNEPIITIWYVAHILVLTAGWLLMLLCVAAWGGISPHPWSFSPYFGFSIDIMGLNVDESECIAAFFILVILQAIVDALA